jgi:hypothetical protein
VLGGLRFSVNRLPMSPKHYLIKLLQLSTF